METLTHQKTFGDTAAEIINDLMDARLRDMKDSGETRISKTASSQAINLVKSWLHLHDHTDENIVSLVLDHFNTLKMILPRDGTDMDQHTQLLKLYARAVKIKSSGEMKSYSYYKVSNSFGESFVKTSSSDCYVGSLTHDGHVRIQHFDRSINRSEGDTVVGITREMYVSGMKRIVKKIEQEFGI